MAKVQRNLLNISDTIRKFIDNPGFVDIYLKNDEVYYKIFCGAYRSYEIKIGNMYSIMNEALPLRIIEYANQKCTKKENAKRPNKEKELEDILSRFDSYKVIGDKKYEVTKEGYSMDIVVRDISDHKSSYLLTYLLLYKNKVKKSSNKKDINTLFALLKGMFANMNKIKAKGGGLFFDIVYYEKGAEDIVKNVIKDKYRINLRIAKDFLFI